MKHYFVYFTTLVALLFVSIGVSSSSAQTLLGGVLFGTEADLGVQVGAYLPVTENIDAGGDFSLFFPGDNLDWYAININGRYGIQTDGNIQFHGIAGLNYTRLSFPSIDLGSIGGFDIGNVGGGSSSEIGLNVGGMASFGSGPVGFYAMIKYVLSSFDQLVAGGGITYTLGS